VRAAVARVGAPALRPGGGVVLAQCIFTSKRKTGCKTKIMDRAAVGPAFLACPSAEGAGGTGGQAVVLRLRRTQRRGPAAPRPTIPLRERAGGPWSLLGLQ
jgi:hypothetical protein